MNFTWVNKKTVRSDTGFEFAFTGQFAAEYRESGRVLRIFVETGGNVATIYENSLQSECTQPVNTPAASSRQRIASNIKAALAFQGFTLELEPGSPPT